MRERYSWGGTRKCRRERNLDPRHWQAHSKFSGNASSPVPFPCIRHEVPSRLPVNRLNRTYYYVSSAFLLPLVSREVRYMIIRGPLLTSLHFPFLLLHISFRACSTPLPSVPHGFPAGFLIKFIIIRQVHCSCPQVFCLAKLSVSNPKVSVFTVYLVNWLLNSCQ